MILTAGFCRKKSSQGLKSASYQSVKKKRCWNKQEKSENTGSVPVLIKHFLLLLLHVHHTIKYSVWFHLIRRQHVSMKTCCLALYTCKLCLIKISLQHLALCSVWAPSWCYHAAITAVAVAAAALIPSTSSGQRSPGSDGGSGQASRLNTLSGIKQAAMGGGGSLHWLMSLCSSLNHLQDTHTHTHIYECYLTHSHTHTAQHIYSAFVGQHGLIQRPDTVSAQISPSLSVTVTEEGEHV